jgi:hypothetical protein
MLDFSPVSLQTNPVPYPFMILSVYICPLGQSETFSAFDVRHRAEVSPSARCVSTADVACRCINTVTCMSDYRRGLDWRLDLLTTLTQDS